MRFVSWAPSHDLLQALLGPLLDFRRELVALDEALEGFGRPGLADLDQEVDESDLDEGIGLDGQGPDQAFLDARPVAEKVQGVDGGQPDVGVGVVVEGVEQGGQRLVVGIFDRGAVADALEPVLGRGLTQERQGDLLAHVLDLARQGGQPGPALEAAA